MPRGDIGNTAVSEIMTRDVITIRDDLKIDVALELMHANTIRRLPVVSGTGHVIGILTEADARVAMPKGTSYFSDGDLAEDIPEIRDVMTHNVHSVAPDASLAEVADLMVNFRIGGVPVLDDKELVGIVTESDIFKYIASDDD